MREKIAVFAVLLLAAGALCLLGSCEEEKCSPCDAGSSDPAERLIGAWEVFEAFLNGSPNPGSVGMVMDFRDENMLIVNSDTFDWYATDDVIIVISGSIGAGLTFDYYFDADTLDMTNYAYGDTTHLRLIEMIMPVDYEAVYLPRIREGGSRSLLEGIE